jgi:hypothetical protein
VIHIYRATFTTTFFTSAGLMVEDFRLMDIGREKEDELTGFQGQI